MGLVTVLRKVSLTSDTAAQIANPLDWINGTRSVQVLITSNVLWKLPGTAIGFRAKASYICQVAWIFYTIRRRFKTGCTLYLMLIFEHISSTVVGRQVPNGTLKFESEPGEDTSCEIGTGSICFGVKVVASFNWLNSCRGCCGCRCRSRFASVACIVVVVSFAGCTDTASWLTNWKSVNTVICRNKTPLLVPE